MIIKCPTCSTKFRLPDERMKSMGIRVRCSQCDSVFRAGPPGPNDKYARVLARGVSKVGPPRAGGIDHGKGAEQNTETQSEQSSPRTRTKTQDALPPGRWESLPPTPPEIIAPPLNEVTATSETSVGPDLIPPISVSDAVNTELAPDHVSDDLFADLAAPSERAVSVPAEEEADSEIISGSSGQGFQDLFPEMEKSLSSPSLTPPPAELLDSGRDPVFSDSLFIDAPDSATPRTAQQLESEFMEVSDTGASPPLMDNISMPSDMSPPPPEEKLSEDSQAVGKIKLNKARQARDGSIEAVPPRPSTRPQTVLGHALNIPEPGYIWRALATLLLLFVFGLSALIFIAEPDLNNFPDIDVRRAQQNLEQFYTKFINNPQEGPFKLVDFAAESYRLGPEEREVLMIQGRAVNTSTKTFENAVAVVDIVHDGASVRRTMSSLGLQLNDQALSRVLTKNDLAKVWNDAKLSAYNQGLHKAMPGETREFIFILWDVPPQLEQSAIYVAFRAGRGTLTR